MTEVSTRVHRGWDLVVLENDRARVEVVPGKGGDVLSFRARPAEVDVLWSSPWGLRQRGAAATPGTSADTLMEWYPGGWQTLLPNGGDETPAYGTTWGMHGEVWTTPFDADLVHNGVDMHARLVRSPLEVTRRIRLDGGALSVTETVHNRGRDPVDGVWGHHPAFAPDVFGGGELTCGAAEVIVDDRRDTAAGDLVIDGRGPWPHAPARAGGQVDLRRIPEREGPAVERMAYLSGFTEGWAQLQAHAHGLSARLRWDAARFPVAWLWTEFHATPGFPWFGAVDVLAVEPCTGYPAQGRDVVAERSGLQRFDPGIPLTTTVTLEVRQEPT